MKHRKLTAAEQKALTAQGCSAEKWDLIEVADGFSTDRVQGVRFSGAVRIGRLEGAAALAGGEEVPCGLYDSRIHNCTFGDDVRKLTGGVGAELVVETVGGAVFPGPLRSLARGGRYVVIGELYGKPVEINLALVILKEWEIYGVESASRDDLNEILHFMQRTGLTPAIWKTMPLDAAAEAHRLLTNREVVGRIVLTP